jgi:hypothetical protein
LTDHEELEIARQHVPFDEPAVTAAELDVRRGPRRAPVAGEMAESEASAG